MSPSGIDVLTNHLFIQPLELVEDGIEVVEAMVQNDEHKERVSGHVPEHIGIFGEIVLEAVCNMPNVLSLRSENEEDEQRHCQIYANLRVVADPCADCRFAVGVLFAVS